MSLVKTTNGDGRVLNVLWTAEGAAFCNVSSQVHEHVQYNDNASLSVVSSLCMCTQFAASILSHYDSASLLGGFRASSVS